MILDFSTFLFFVNIMSQHLKNLYFAIYFKLRIYVPEYGTRLVKIL